MYEKSHSSDGMNCTSRSAGWLDTPIGRYDSAVSSLCGDASLGELLLLLFFIIRFLDLSDASCSVDSYGRCYWRHRLEAGRMEL